MFSASGWLKRIDDFQRTQQPLERLVPFQDGFTRQPPPPAFPRVALPLRRQNRPRLLRRFVHADQDEPAARLGVRPGIGRRLKNRRRPVHRVDLRFEFAGQRIFNGAFNDEFFRRDEIADGVVRSHCSGQFLDGEHFVFQ